MKPSFRFQRLCKFEYWPFWFFYLPFIPLWLFYSLRSFNFLYFTRVNYKTTFGGFFQYSKFSLLKNIDSKYLPKTNYYSSKKDLIADSENLIFEKKFICKPDVGERGKGVELINDREKWFLELESVQFPCIIQEYIELPIELGVLFYRFPNGNKGITSIVRKGFLQVIGNGKLTLKELVEDEIRAYNRIEYLKNKFEKQWDLVVEDGKQILLEEIGNHCRGTAFYNENNIISKELVDVMDSITKNIEGFHYGRIDLKCNSYNELYNGINIKLMEVNGVNSEAAHIYDSNMKLMDAYKDVYSNLNIVFKISKELQKQKIKTPNSLSEFIKAFFIHFYG